MKELNRELRRCAYCGKTFMPRAKGQEFCSKRCEMLDLEELQYESEFWWLAEDL